MALYLHTAGIALFNQPFDQFLFSNDYTYTFRSQQFKCRKTGKIRSALYTNLFYLHGRIIVVGQHWDVRSLFDYTYHLMHIVTVFRQLSRILNQRSPDIRILLQDPANLFRFIKVSFHRIDSHHFERSRRSIIDRRPVYQDPVAGPHHGMKSKTNRGTSRPPYQDTRLRTKYIGNHLFGLPGRHRLIKAHDNTQISPGQRFMPLKYFCHAVHHKKLKPDCFFHGHAL